ncbi:hypothetical protein, partial [Escherichia coli]|uniref:hypothetical protein n=2 Tax=Escherichia coli TaxID=562 RepID=UPI00226E6F74
SLKTSIKTITYLSDIGCLEIQGASLKCFGENMRQYLCIVMPNCYERWCHQYSEAGQSSQKTSLWIKAVLTGYDHSHTERESGGTKTL